MADLGGAPLLELKGLSFAYHGREPVAEDLDLSVPEGEIHLLEGPSGSGKSTLLRIATGLIPRVQGGRIAGRALLDGQPVAEIPAARIPARIGWVPQDPEESFAARTVERELGQLARNLDLDRSAGRRALADLAAENLLDRRVDELSGGEAARVALTAAGLGDPDALVLDEPTAQLDRAGRNQTAAWLAERRRSGTAVLAAEHTPHPLASLADRVHELDTGRPERPDVHLPEPERGRPLARLEGAVHSYDDGPTIGPVDLELAPGEVVCLTGPNGSGKTTALHMLAGLLDPDEGHVDLAGAPPGKLEPTELAIRLGIAFQHPAWHITQDTVAEELAFTPQRLDRPVDVGDRLAALGLAPFADEHPWDLSGGQRQRMAVATATAHDPAVLCLDEPTRGLDPASLARLVDLLTGRVEQGKATLLASHHPWMAEIAHRTVHLEAPT